MAYPYQSTQAQMNQSAYAFDQFGSAAEFAPYVARSTAGAIAPGQTTLACSGRISTSTTATTTVPLCTVPAAKTFFVTDFCLSTIAAVELDCQLEAGSITIDREVTSSTSPITVVHETQPMAPGSIVVSLVLPETASADNVDFFVAGYFQAAPGSY